MKSTSRAANKKRPGMLGRVLGVIIAVLFIGGFVVMPLIIGGFAFNSVFKWWDARDWRAVPATVLEADLDVRRDSDGATYRVKARYRYRFEGQTLESERVDFHSGADNIGDYHQRMYRRLDAARQSGGTVTAWVDPRDPARAVLHRDLRWGLFGVMLLFPLIFGGVAVALFFGFRAARRGKQHREAASEIHPDEPWRWSERWSGTTLSSQSRHTVWAAVGFAALWNVVSAPVAFLVPGEVADGNTLALVGLLFPLVGIGLAIWAVREILRRRRYGESLLHLDDLPVPLGGVLRARLEVPARLEARELDVHLTCVRRVRSGHGKNRRTREHVLWEDSLRVMSMSGGAPGATSSRIEARLPGDRPEASDEDSDERVLWQLEVTSEEPGVDYKATFELPVFDTGEVSDASVLEESGDAMQSSEADWRETGVEHGYASGGQRFHFPRLRMLGGGLTTLVFALVFLGAGLGIAIGAGHWIFGGIFAVVGGLILLLAFSMLFQRSEIVIGRDRIRWRHGVFGGWREVETGAVKAIRIKKTGSAGRKLFFHLELDAWGDARPSKLADWVPNERAAGALARHLEHLAGVTP